jgi:uncharacterized protein DUF2784
VGFRFLADLVVAVHFAFVLFVVGGGLAVLRWPRLAWLHVPAALWGFWVELAGVTCPLTPLESWLLERGGAGEQAGSFVERHLLPLLYPVALTRELQWLLAGAVLAINGVVYAIHVGRSSRGR